VFNWREPTSLHPNNLRGSVNMKESQFTGAYIYEAVKFLEEKVQEIAKAMDMVEDECGKGSLPYTILKQAYEEKKVSLQKARTTRYEEVK